jgi:4-aminobutyrate aminotransferase-like enzyme
MAIHRRYQEAGFLAGKGLVAGLACIQPGHGQPDGQLAHDIVWRCVEKGLLMFSPVGPQGCTIKVAPPLCITHAAVQEGCQVLEESFGEILAERSAGG